MRFTSAGIFLRLFGLFLDVALSVAGFSAATIVPAIATMGTEHFLRFSNPGVDLAAYAVISAASLLYFKTYRMIWSYTSLRDLVDLISATVIAVVVFAIVEFAILHPHAQISAIMIVWPATLIWMSSLLFLVAPRLGARMLDERNRRFANQASATASEGPVPILVNGDPKRIEMFIRECARNSNSKYEVIGVFTDDQRLQGNSLHGIEVHGQVSAKSLDATLARLARRHRVPKILVLADDYPDQKLFSELLTVAACSNLRLARLLPFGTFEGEASVQPIAISDLLGRPEIKLGASLASTLVQGQRVLVTGAGGSIGSELCRQIASLRPALLVIADSNEFNLYSIDQELAEKFPAVVRKTALLDVRDGALVMQWMRDTKPHIVFHAAALKHVPLVEEHPIEAIKTNVFGTVNVADACRECGCAAMVIISTDKAVNPHNVMGATKRLAEAYCQGVDQSGDSTRFITVRFGNVLGSAGSVVPLFQRQIDAGGPVTVTHAEIKRFFMTIPEAVSLVLQAGAQHLPASSERGSIYVLDMGEPVRIVDLARQMIRLSGRQPDIDIKIELVGLRPGEKLYEEVVHTSERIVETENKAILRVTPRTTDIRILRQQIQELRNACNTWDIARAIRVLKLTVPEYHTADAESDGGPRLIREP